MNKLILHKYGKEHPISFNVNKYVHNGNFCVRMITHEEGYPAPWSDLTVNFNVKCKENCGYIDINNNGVEIIEWLTSHKLGRLTGKIHPSGWCVYPEFEFNMEKLMDYVKEN